MKPLLASTHTVWRIPTLVIWFQYSAEDVGVRRPYARKSSQTSLTPRMTSSQAQKLHDESVSLVRIEPQRAVVLHFATTCGQGPKLSHQRPAPAVTSLTLDPNEDAQDKSELGQRGRQRKSVSITTMLLDWRKHQRKTASPPTWAHGKEGLGGVELTSL